MRSVAAVLIVVLLPVTAFAQAKPAPAAPPPPAPPAAAGSAAAPAGAAAAAGAAAPQGAAPAAAPQGAAPQGAAPQAGASAVPPLPPENFTYQPDGRRDPFLSLVGAGGQTESHGKKGEGVGAFSLAEVSVRGIVQSKGRLLAMAETPDGKTYLIHAGDKLADGVVKSVMSDGLVFIQDINDPLSVQKQREVRKLLRSLEDAKE
ncbi:MAG TPA: pilus assembly protein PilP [Vicinamibacterales bacterium]|jgi:Tfp pilus assembly protein PilP